MKLMTVTYCKAALCGAILTASLAVGAGAARAELAVTFDRPQLENLAQTTATTLIGWSFTTDKDLYVTKLGLWDFERDQVPEHNHFVGLWDKTGALQTSVTINEPAAPAHPNTPFHFAEIPRYLLKAGSYTLAAIVGNDLFTYHTPTTVDPSSNTVPFNNIQFKNVTYLQDAFYDLADGGTVNQVNFGSFSVTTGVTGAGTVIGGFGANMDAVPTPIPAAVYLFGSGLLGLVGFRRRNT